MPTDNTGSAILDLTRRLTPHRADLIEQAEFNLARERWCDKAEAWIENDGYHERAKKLQSDDDEERAAIESEEGYSAPRGFAEIYTLEDMAESSLLSPERFQGEHWCAQMILEKDIPKWRSEARVLVSGLGGSR